MSEGCARCGKELIGRQTRWCSDNCRKDGVHGVCEVCGGETHHVHVAAVCATCNHAIRTNGKTLRLEAVARWYNEGLTVREIALKLGYSPNSKPGEITEARQAGLITHYRYQAYADKS